MTIFSSKKSAIERLNDLQLESNVILSVFEQTAIDLEVVNDKIKVDQSIIEASIIELQASLNASTGNYEANLRVASKIRNFLNE